MGTVRLQSCQLIRLNPSMLQVRTQLEGKAIKKVIFVPGKIMNIIVGK